jgi:hypothetical protein
MRESREAPAFGRIEVLSSANGYGQPTTSMSE